MESDESYIEYKMDKKINEILSDLTDEINKG